uniref:Uncharacterized protein n=1 Tax=Anguilla anguilla TaxID=7936 RepID=A0A0E9Q7J2_ANGAN
MVIMLIKKELAVFIILHIMSNGSIDFSVNISPFHFCKSKHS